MSIESTCQKVLELFDELSEMAETLSRIEKSDKARPVLAEMREKAGELHEYLSRGGVGGRQKYVRRKTDGGEEEEDDGRADGHVSLENGRSVDFGRQMDGMERMKAKRRRDSWTSN